MFNKIFKRPETFNVTNEMSPAQKAKQTWDDRIGNAVMQAYSWRMCTFVLCATLFFAIGGLIYMSNKTMYMPYVVTFDKSAGKVEFAGAVSPSSNYVPQEELIEYFVRGFVENIRTIPYDPDVYEANWTKAFYFMTKDASRQLKEKRKIENPYVKLLKSTTSITINTVIPVSKQSENIQEGNQTYQINWEENETDKGSGTVVVTPYTGLITLTYIQPDKKETAVQNPLGIYVADFKYERSGESYNKAEGPKNQNQGSNVQKNNTNNTLPVVNK